MNKKYYIFSLLAGLFITGCSSGSTHVSSSSVSLDIAVNKAILTPNIVVGEEFVLSTQSSLTDLTPPMNKDGSFTPKFFIEGVAFGHSETFFAPEPSSWLLVLPYPGWLMYPGIEKRYKIMMPDYLKWIKYKAAHEACLKYDFDLLINAKYVITMIDTPSDVTFACTLTANKGHIKGIKEIEYEY